MERIIPAAVFLCETINTSWFETKNLHLKGIIIRPLTVSLQVWLSKLGRFIASGHQVTSAVHPPFYIYLLINKMETCFQYTVAQQGASAGGPSVFPEVKNDHSFLSLRLGQQM